MEILKILLLSFHGMSNESTLVLLTKYWKAIHVVNPSLFTCLSNELYLPFNKTRFEILETSTPPEGDFIRTSTKL
jgi:hypothetical protein